MQTPKRQEKMPAWSDKERSKMFLAMIELMAPHGSNSKLPTWTLVAERMQSGFTGEAVRQQFQKCRREGLPRQPHSTIRSTSGGVPKPRCSRSKKRFSSGCGEYDDDEEVSLYSSRKKIKQEGGDKFMMGEFGEGSGLTYDGPGIGGTKGAVLKKEKVNEDKVVQMEGEEE